MFCNLHKSPDKSGKLKPTHDELRATALAIRAHMPGN
jgi:hypothetical protein